MGVWHGNQGRHGQHQKSRQCRMRKRKKGSKEKSLEKGAHVAYPELAFVRENCIVDDMCIVNVSKQGQAVGQLLAGDTRGGEWGAAVEK